MNPFANESDKDLVFRLQGALQAVITALGDARPDVLDKIRRDEIRLEVSRDGIRQLRLVADGLTGAGDQIADEVETFLKWDE